jgi:hypothetical protein
VSEDDRRTASIAANAAYRSVPEMVYPYRAGLIGGAFGGLAMVAVAIIYGVTSGHGIWPPVNLIGATLIRDLQSASIDQLSRFNANACVAGLALHTLLAVGLGFLFALLMPTFPGSPIIWSLIVGPLLWSIASLLTLPSLNPVMNSYVDRWSFFVAHGVYALVLGVWIARTPKVRA